MSGVAKVCEFGHHRFLEIDGIIVAMEGDNCPDANVRNAHGNVSDKWTLEMLQALCDSLNDRLAFQDHKMAAVPRQWDEGGGYR